MRTTLGRYGRVISAANRTSRKPGDPRRGFYYVSCQDDRGRRALVFGPFVNDHRSALADVARVAAEAERVDPRACWYAWGTARSETDLGPGVLGAPTPRRTAA